MKKIINNKNQIVDDMLMGYVKAHSDRVKFSSENNRIILRKIKKDENKTSLLITFLTKSFSPLTTLINKNIDRFSNNGKEYDEGEQEITEADIQALTALGEMEGQILPAVESFVQI